METRPGWEGVDEHGARREQSFRRQKSSPLDGVKYPFSEQRKACSTISLPFDQFQLGDVFLDHPIIDPPGEPGSHRLFVFLYSNSKGLEFGKVAALHLSQPWIEEFSLAAAQHLRKLLNQVISQIDLRVKLTKLGQRFQLLATQLFRAAKKQESSLSWGRKRRGLG